MSMAAGHLDSAAQHCRKGQHGTEVASPGDHVAHPAVAMETVLGTSMRRSTADICWSMDGSLCRLDNVTSCRRDVAAASLPLVPAKTGIYMVSANAGHLTRLIQVCCVAQHDQPQRDQHSPRSRWLAEA